MKAVVVYASKYGSTRGIAEFRGKYVVNRAEEQRGALLPDLKVGVLATPAPPRGL